MKRSIGNPSSLPLGTSKCCGQPHPQKLNCSRLSPPIGLFSSRLRNVLSNGIVNEESVDLRSMVFDPGLTGKVDANKNFVKYNTIE